MPNQIEYKRVTKNILISRLTLLALFFLVSVLFFDWIMFPIWMTLHLFFQSLFEYLLDKKMRPKLITPIYFFVSACLFVLLYFVSAYHSIPLALNLIFVIGLFISNVIGSLKEIENPPFVIDGKYDIEDGIKYAKKQAKKMFLILGIAAILLTIFYFILLIWKNSLL